MSTDGCLYLCATPIGNLEDVTLRVLRILRDADLIIAEDTRHTRKLLNHYDIRRPLLSYHEHNKQEREPELIGRLVAGERIALVSDAGTPGIADPGAALVSAAIAHGIRVEPLPGANAAISALIASGLDTVRFAFVGFLPRTAKKRRLVLAEVKSWSCSLIFYEAANRIAAQLSELRDFLGDRPAVVARELTKIHEEFSRSTLAELADYYRGHNARGEFVIVIAGFRAEVSEQPDDSIIMSALENELSLGSDKKAALAIVAKRLKIPKKQVYKLALTL